MARRQIWKYSVTDELGEEVTFVTAPGKVVYSELNPGVVTLWVEAVEGPQVTRVCLVVGTGHPIPEGFAHLNTVRDRQFAWHLYLKES